MVEAEDHLLLFFYLKTDFLCEKVKGLWADMESNHTTYIKFSFL